MLKAPEAELIRLLYSYSGFSLSFSSTSLNNALISSMFDTFAPSNLSDRNFL